MHITFDTLDFASVHSITMCPSLETLCRCNSCDTVKSQILDEWL